MFDQWVYGAGSPRVTVKPSYSARNATLTLVLTQTQANDTITPSVFRLPLELAIDTKDGNQIEKIEMNQRTQTFKIKLGSKPTKIDFDPNERIPLKRLTVRPIANLR